MLRHIPLNALTLIQLASLNAQMNRDRSATGCSHSPTEFWGKAVSAPFLKQHRIWINARTLEREGAVAVKMGFIPGSFHCSPSYCPLVRSHKDLQLKPSWVNSLERQVLGNGTNFNGKKWLKRLGNICLFLDTLWIVKVPHLNLPWEWQGHYSYITHFKVLPKKEFSFSFSGYPQRGRGMSSQQDRKALFSVPAGCWDPSQKSFIEKMLKGLAGPSNCQPKLRFFSSLPSPFNDVSPVHSLTWLVLHYSLCNTPLLCLSFSLPLSLFFFVPPVLNWKFRSVAEQGKNWNGQRLLSRFDSQCCLSNYKVHAKENCTSRKSSTCSPATLFSSSGPL